MAKLKKNDPGHPLGLHRVLDKRRCLPQEADNLDNSAKIRASEMRIDVERLNIDAASFRQMEEQCSGDAEAIGSLVLENTLRRGKQQNAMTGSGGMLIGTIAEIGAKCEAGKGFRVGQRVATLVSLTLTPLSLKRILKVHLHSHQIEVEGHAILFSTSILAKLPTDLEENVAMSVLDVAGAPATVLAMVKPKDRVVILGGGGKAGLLSCLAARQKMGRTGKLIAIEPNAAAAAELSGLGLCDAVLPIDATDPVAMLDAVSKETRGQLADVVVNVASAPNTEVGSILAVRTGGKVLFFGMATLFTRVALGAEGVVKHASFLFGNGYRPGHSKVALELLRSHPGVLEVFRKRYG